MKKLSNSAEAAMLLARRRITICVVLVMMFLGAESTVNAAITDTNVSAGMRIDVEGVTEVSGSDTGTTYASVDLTSPSTGARVSSLLHINALSAEAANLNFNLLLNGNNMPGQGYLGQLSEEGSNSAEILYHADIGTTMGYSWNFDYIGSNPFGLQVIYIKENGTTIATLGDVGSIGHHEGSDTFGGLLAGNDYVIQTMFTPNVFGGVGSIEGTLAGDISFSFVPEPATICLLGLGALGLLRRKRSV
jgi:hypothetical protein